MIEIVADKNGDNHNNNDDDNKNDRILHQYITYSNLSTQCKVDVWSMHLPIGIVDSSGFGAIRVSEEIVAGHDAMVQYALPHVSRFSDDGAAAVGLA